MLRCAFTLPFIPSLPNTMSNLPFPDNTPIRHKCERDYAYGVLETVQGPVAFRVINAAWGVSYETVRDFIAAHYRRLGVPMNHTDEAEYYAGDGVWNTLPADADMPAVTEFKLIHCGNTYTAYRLDSCSIYAYSAVTGEYVGQFNPVQNIINHLAPEPAVIAEYRCARTAASVAEVALDAPDMAEIHMYQSGANTSCIRIYREAGRACIEYDDARIPVADADGLDILFDAISLCPEFDTFELSIPGYPNTHLTSDVFHDNVPLIKNCLVTFLGF